MELARELVDEALIYSVSATDYRNYMLMVNRSCKEFGFIFTTDDNMNFYPVKKN